MGGTVSKKPNPFEISFKGGDKLTISISDGYYSLKLVTSNGETFEFAEPTTVVNTDTIRHERYLIGFTIDYATPRVSILYGSYNNYEKTGIIGELTQNNSAFSNSTSTSSDVGFGIFTNNEMRAVKELKSKPPDLIPFDYTAKKEHKKLSAKDRMLEQQVAYENNTKYYESCANNRDVIRAYQKGGPRTLLCGDPATEDLVGPDGSKGWSRCAREKTDIPLFSKINSEQTGKKYGDIYSEVEESQVSKLSCPYGYKPLLSFSGEENANMVKRLGDGIFSMGLFKKVLGNANINDDYLNNRYMIACEKVIDVKPSFLDDCCSAKSGLGPDNKKKIDSERYINDSERGFCPFDPQSCACRSRYLRMKCARDDKNEECVDYYKTGDTNLDNARKGFISESECMGQPDSPSCSCYIARSKGNLLYNLFKKDSPCALHGMKDDVMQDISAPNEACQKIIDGSTTEISDEELLKCNPSWKLRKIDVDFLQSRDKAIAKADSGDAKIAEPPTSTPAETPASTLTPTPASTPALSASEVNALGTTMIILLIVILIIWIILMIFFTIPMIVITLIFVSISALIKLFK